MSSNHPEWEKENSLSSPSDRIRENNWRPEQGAPQLTEPEVSNAMKILNNTAFTDKFPRVDRTYADPIIPLQNIGLISFTPAKGAKPNDQGVYGFAKLRGNYGTETEANQRAEFLIRNADSYHQIYHTYVGRPFPITASSDYSGETSEVDIRRETTQSVSNNIKEKKQADQQVVQEIKDREEALLAETSRSEVDPQEEYTTLRVKKAQLSWTFLEHQKKMDEVKNILIKTRNIIAEMDEKDPVLRTKYYDKYMAARKSAGFPNSGNSEENFIKYMVEDADLGF